MRGFPFRLLVTFRGDHASGYLAVTRKGGPKNPVYVTCHKAAALLEQGQDLELPAGFASDALSSYCLMASYDDREFKITRYQAEDIADIGKQVLEHFRNGKLYLEQDEVDAIEYLTEKVNEEAQAFSVN